MRHQGPPEDDNTPRDPLLEAAFTQFVQQAQASSEFAARVRAQAALLTSPGLPLWSVLGNVSDMPLASSPRFDIKVAAAASSVDVTGRLRLAFVDDAREQDVRAVFLYLHATIIDGPSPQGVYTVQVPLARLFPRLRGHPEPPPTADPMHLLLEELRGHPAVRSVELVPPPQ